MLQNKNAVLSRLCSEKSVVNCKAGALVAKRSEGGVGSYLETSVINQVNFLLETLAVKIGKQVVLPTTD